MTILSAHQTCCVLKFYDWMVLEFDVDIDSLIRAFLCSRGVEFEISKLSTLFSLFMQYLFRLFFRGMNICQPLFSNTVLVTCI